MSDRVSDKKADDAATVRASEANPGLVAARAALGQRAKAAEAASAPRPAASAPAQPRGPIEAVPVVALGSTPVPATDASQAIAAAAASAVATETAAAHATAAPTVKEPPSPVPSLPQTTVTSTPITVTMEKAMSTTEDLMAFGQGNVEAFVKSGQIWANGMQDLGRHLAQSAQAHFDGTMTALKAMASVKSVHEAIELQSSAARTAIEKAVLDGGKLTDASLKLAEQTLAPLTARVTIAAERFGRVAA